ncbi:putative type I restriction enzymeP M protein [Pelagimonas phthalicica]|uniref:site-specific DNA-methyltransferase (adenine-specific) n=1 Tax=Pelagimonas phthalicica TaxID=1037362 RepID=A0A238JI45_9RHOB|nr:class I SAM-dependent DNA methyltransferase [Pelagimonas phthalicica]TDS92433.1 type I restriction enzyme M protein [Pelagimonas phthalicica]SMX29496.1 putative type I restriction enzymeP M protein [Pelagimonas phthalicica]
MTNEQLVSKVWNYAHVLRDQGVSYGDYIEQITYLLFLKMDQERVDLLGEPSAIPTDWQWSQLSGKTGDELELHYRHTLEALAKEGGLIGTIFRKAQNKLSDPAKLTRVVSLIDKEGPWIGIGVDVKGQIYEGLLEKNASEVRSGAGQYFTPRPVIDAVVECVAPKIGETVCDPACGTGGFLLSAYDHMKGQTQDRDRLRDLRHTSFTGVDIVDEVVRLCAMNLYLHGVGDGGSPVYQGDALSGDNGKRFDVVLTNPPFGKKSSYKVVGEDGQVSTERENYEREDFKFTTSNKQFNFLQHIMTVMEANGRAGVVLPDNVLFEAGRAGEGIRKRLLEGFNFHTLLRLPTGIWYSPGVKANVLFFDKRPASKEAQTKELWVYDYRTNIHKTLKTKLLVRSDLDDFVRCYKERKETERFKRFTYDEMVGRDKLNLDIFWLKDDSLEDIDALPTPDVLAAEIVENLEAALGHFRSVAEELGVEEE